MNVIRKDATIANTDEEFPGSFEVVLSTPAKDRDGDELAAEDWKQPLPEHITFDTDHGMSVAATVGSGAPTMEDGKIVVRGTYSSLPRAQEARTLVKEGHIRTVSVAFMSEKVTKDGKTRTVRELLNGAFVAIPSNREAVVLAAKGLDVKAGARNSAADMAHVQAIYDHAVALGAGPMDDTQAAEGANGGKSMRRMVALKAVEGSYEERERAISDALSAAYPGDDAWAYSIATFDDSVVYRVSGGGMQAGQWQASYTYDGGVVTLGEPERVSLVEQIVPAKSFSAKAFIEAEATVDSARLAQAVDASLDDCLLIINQLDRGSLPPQVQQLLDTVTAAAVCVDQLLDAMGVDDPDDTDDTNETEETTPPAKTVDADALELKNRLTAITVTALAG